MKANKYFTVEELVSEEVYDLLGDNAIRLLEPAAVQILEEVREILGVPLICNNWVHGGKRNYCGYRDLHCSIGAKKSAHKEGKAFDLISTKMSATEMRQILKDNADRLSYPIRIEDDVTWLHIDTRGDHHQKIYFFKA